MGLETINITKIVNGGYGFARLSNGLVTLVRHVLADETVIITTEEAKKNHIFGKVQQILKEHPARRIPPCKYSGQCGGCDLQHCDYDTQLIIKRGIVEDLLRRQNQKAVVESINLLTAPIPSPSTFAYRQRIRLQVGDRGAVGGERGAERRRPRTDVPPECPSLPSGRDNLVRWPGPGRECRCRCP